MQEFASKQISHRDVHTEEKTPESTGCKVWEKSRRPVIGYVGGLHRHVDVNMIRTMASTRPSWLWVLVGPVQTAIGDLARLANVVLVGQQPFNKLVHYIKSFDVCIVPYLNNRETATIVPTKINEYLAAGKPVVSTNLPAVCDFNKQHDVLLAVASQSQAFPGCH